MQSLRNIQETLANFDGRVRSEHARARRQGTTQKIRKFVSRGAARFRFME
jgi:hypothetical protein